MVRRWLCAVAAALGMAASAAAQPARDGVSGWFEPPGRPVWAGEVFDLKLVWQVDWATFGNLEGPLDWTPDPLVAGPFSEPVLEQRGDGTARILFSTRAIALAPGAIALKPARQSMVLQTGMLNAGDVPIAVTESRAVLSAGTRLVARPLPPAPAGFAGAVGRFTLAATAEPLSPQVGEAVTWTVTLSGEGNWPLIRALPARMVSRDFDVFGKPETVAETGETPFAGSLRETVTLVPRVAGAHRLGPVEMAVFDPVRGAYVTIAAPAIALEVQPGPGARESAASRPSGAQERRFPPAIGGSARAVPPLAPWAWRLGLAVPPLLVVAAWAALVWARAVRRDPARPLRRAHRALARMPDGDWTRSGIRAWQTAFAARHDMAEAAPVADSFADPEARTLWRESETSLYAPGDRRLPADWRGRMKTYVSRLGPPPKFDVRALLRREALLPLAALALIAGPPGPASAASAQRDWKAHYGEAREAALDGRWKEAAPHAVTAWLQHPSAETGALWALAARESGFVTERGGVPLPPRGWRGVFASLSPPGWQRLALALLSAGTAGAVLVLSALYGMTHRRLWRAGAALLTAAAALGSVCAAALGFYGPAGAAGGVVVTRPVPLLPLPVDVPEAGQPIVPAGMAGVLDGAFLGWRRVRFADGTAGWVGVPALVQIWERPGPDP